MTPLFETWLNRCLNSGAIHSSVHEQIGEKRAGLIQLQFCDEG